MTLILRMAVSLCFVPVIGSSKSHLISQCVDTSILKKSINSEPVPFFYISKNSSIATNKRLSKNSIDISLYELKEQAELGFPDSQYKLSQIYINSKNRSKWYEGIYWLQASANSDYGPALKNIYRQSLRILIIYGNNKSFIADRIIGWMKMKASSGDFHAQDILSIVYSKGLGVPIDMKEVRKYRSMATESR